MGEIPRHLTAETVSCQAASDRHDSCHMPQYSRKELLSDDATHSTRNGECLKQEGSGEGVRGATPTRTHQMCDSSGTSGKRSSAVIQSAWHRNTRNTQLPAAVAKSPMVTTRADTWVKGRGQR